MAISAGPLDPFNHAISFIVSCDDRRRRSIAIGDALLGRAARPSNAAGSRIDTGCPGRSCPSVLSTLMTDPDREKAKRVSDAMLKQVKFDIAELKRAAAGEARV